MANFKSPRRLCLTADGRVVGHLDPEGVKLLIGKGGEVDEKRAKFLKLEEVCAELDKADAEAKRTEKCNVLDDSNPVIGNKAAHDAAKAKAEAKAAEEAKAKADAAKAKAAK